MSEDSPFQYSDEQMSDLLEALETIDTAVVDGKVMVTVELVSKIAEILLYNMQELGERGLICDAEVMHTMINADYIGKIAGGIKLKHAEETLPDDVAELLDIPED